MDENGNLRGFLLQAGRWSPVKGPTDEHASRLEWCRLGLLVVRAQARGVGHPDRRRLSPDDPLGNDDGDAARPHPVTTACS